MSNILIVGANGFIGSRLQRHLATFCASSSRFLTADLAGNPDFLANPTNFDGFPEFIRDQNVSVIVNLAALSSEKLCREFPDRVHWQNVKFPLCLFKCLRAANSPTHFIQASTEWIYGQNALVPSPTPPELLDSTFLGPYAKSKLNSELELVKLATSSCRLTILRLGIVYSLYDSGCNSFVNAALAAALSGQAFQCKSGDSSRRYVCIDQVCAAFARSIFSTTSQAPLIVEDVQGPELLTNSQVLGMIRHVLPSFKYTVSTESIRPSIRDVSSPVIDLNHSYLLSSQLTDFFRSSNSSL